MDIRYFFRLRRGIKRRVTRRRVKIIRIRSKKLLSHLTVRDYKKHKDSARALAHAQTEYFNQHYGFEIGRITIRNQHTRWGSCSSKKNLSFNYKILFLPPDLRDYIIVHELCHLGEMNHSGKFWALVAQKIPDHKQKRQQIKLY